MKNYKVNKYVAGGSLLLLCLLAGFLGSILTQLYFFKNPLPYYSEINLADSNYRGANFVIRDARKVVVEQNVKVNELYSRLAGNIAGIYKKKTFKSDDNALNNYYQLNKEAGFGLIIATDGWIMAKFEAFTDEQALKKEYVIVTADGRSFDIKKAIKDSLTGMVFLKVGSQDFPVTNFAEYEAINPGDTIAVFNWRREIGIGEVISKAADPNFSADCNKYIEFLKANEELSAGFKNAYAFNMSGDLLGVMESGGKVVSISNFSGMIKGLLQNGNAERINFDASMGRLDHLLNYKAAGGAYVQAIGGELSKETGLKTGSIILSMDGNDIKKDRSFCSLIREYKPGDKVNLRFSNGKTASDIQYIFKKSNK